MTTTTWISIVLALASVVLSLGQGVFWFQIRDLHRRIETTNERVAAVEHSLGECQFRHSSSAATKADVGEVKGAGTSSPVTDTGGLTRGVFVEYYQVADSTAPTVTITTPSEAFESSLPCVCATGTASADTVVVYVNGATATGTTSWSSCADTTGVPLAVQSDARLSGAGVAVIAAAVDADWNWAYDLAPGTYTGTITARAACAERDTGM